MRQANEKGAVKAAEIFEMAFWAFPAICGLAIVFAIRALSPRKSRHRRDALDGLHGILIRPRLEFCQTSGELYYVIHNVGETIASNVEIALPGCQYQRDYTPGSIGHQFFSAMARYGHLRYNRMSPGQTVEFHVTHMPASQDSARVVFSIVLEIQMRWSDTYGDKRLESLMLPIENRRLKTVWRAPSKHARIASA